MITVTCISSGLMSSLLEWRNPQGRESGWLGWHQVQEIGDKARHVRKVAATEAGLCMLTLAAAVETVVYTPLFLIFLLYIYKDASYCRLFAKLIESSTFTIVWGVANLLFNLIFINLHTIESFARREADAIIYQTVGGSLCVPFYRPEDTSVVEMWGADNEQNNDSAASQALIDQGAEFLKTEVLAGASPATLEDFKNVYGDTNIISFITTKAVYIYVAGPKCKSAIPEFFKESTRGSIETWRSKQWSRETVIRLQSLTSDPIQFDSHDPLDEATQAAFTALRGIASEESQRTGTLFMKSWGKASGEI